MVDVLNRHGEVADASDDLIKRRDQLIQFQPICSQLCLSVTM